MSDTPVPSLPSELWQRCPVCIGTGLVSRPEWVAGDQETFTTSNTGPWKCRQCGGSGLVVTPVADRGGCLSLEQKCILGRLAHLLVGTEDGLPIEWDKLLPAVQSLTAERDRLANAERIPQTVMQTTAPVPTLPSDTLDTLIDAVQRTAQSLMGDSVQILPLEEITKRGDENAAARDALKEYVEKRTLTREEAEKCFEVVSATHSTRALGRNKELLAKLRLLSSEATHE